MRRSRRTNEDADLSWNVGVDLGFSREGCDWYTGVAELIGFGPKKLTQV